MDAIPCAGCGQPVTFWQGTGARRVFNANPYNPYEPHVCALRRGWETPVDWVPVALERAMAPQRAGGPAVVAARGMLTDSLNLE